MGLFSVTCVKCGRSFRRGDRYCPYCGAGSAAGWDSCGQCGTAVPADANYCSRCGADLREAARPRIVDNVWRRDSEEFAVRIEAPDLKGLLVKGLVVEHGTKALVFHRGQCLGIAEPGRYDVDGFLARVARLDFTHPSAAVLIDAGDTAIPFDVPDVLTRDNLKVQLRFSVTLQVARPADFFVHFFKGRRRVTIPELADSLAQEARAALVPYAGDRPAEQLVAREEPAAEVENRLKQELGPILERMGLAIVHLRYLECRCPEYERIREDLGKITIQGKDYEVTRDRLLLGQRLREVLTADKMHALKTDKDFENFVRQQEHELGLKDVIRADEMQRLQEQFRDRRDKEALARRIEIEGIRQEHQRNQARLDLIAEEERKTIAHREDLARQLAQAKSQAEIREIQLKTERAEFELKCLKAEKALELKKRKALDRVEVAAAEQKVEAATLEARSKATAEALVTVLDGPAADRLIRLEEIRQREKLSPEQMLALAAAASPAAAQALAEKYKADALLRADQVTRLEQYWAAGRQEAKDAADRLERIFSEALRQMGWTAATRATQAGPVVVPSAGGPPFYMGVPTATAPGPDAIICPQCGKPTAASQARCQHCQGALR